MTGGVTAGKPIVTEIAVDVAPHWSSLFMEIALNWWRPALSAAVGVNDQKPSLVTMVVPSHRTLSYTVTEVPASAVPVMTGNASPVVPPLLADPTDQMIALEGTL
jgi:hypothetical protein